MSLLPNHARDERPWGSFELFTLNELSTVKLLNVSAGKRFSLQTHTERNEYWHVVSGDGIAHINDEELRVKMDDIIEIPAGTPHRLTGGDNGIVVLEIATGTFDENDIHRIEDDYGRL